MEIPRKCRRSRPQHRSLQEVTSGERKGAAGGVIGRLAALSQGCGLLGPYEDGEESPEAAQHLPEGSAGHAQNS